MKIPRFPYLLLGGVLLLLTFAPVSTSVTAEPQINTFHLEGTFVAADCGDFLAIDDFVQDLRRIRFFDNEGNLVGVQFHFNFRGVITRSDGTGPSLRDPGHITGFVDVEEGTLATAGLLLAITVPGEGIAVLDAGRVVFDADGNVIFEGGPHLTDAEGEALICAALN